MEKTFKEKLEAYCRLKQLKMSWQALKFGFTRAVIECPDADCLERIRREVQSKLRSAEVNYWQCFDGQYEGFVYVMKASDAEELRRQMKQEQDRVDAWWEQHHRELEASMNKKIEERSVAHG